MRPNRYPYSGRIKTPTSVSVREWVQEVEKDIVELGLQNDKNWKELVSLAVANHQSSRHWL
ncbi:hypothetical protein ACXM1Q_001710 [Streptococcus sp. 10F2]